jgi:predicted esterase
MGENLAYIHTYKPGTGKWQNVTLFVLHGTGGDEHSLAELGRMILPGAGQLRPRGNVLEQGMSRFFRRFAEGVLDIDDLKLRTHELADFLEQAGDVYGFHGQQIVIVGFSNGANIASSMLLTRSEMLQSAILLHPMFTFEPETLPDLRDKPIFIGAGRLDPLVPTEQTEQLANLLERAGASVELFWHNSGHEVSVEEVKAAKQWMERQCNLNL